MARLKEPINTRSQQCVALDTVMRSVSSVGGQDTETGEGLVGLEAITNGTVPHGPGRRTFITDSASAKSYHDGFNHN